MQKSKIDAVYRLLGCNNSDIARILDCSPSDISRTRSGTRKCKPTSRPVSRFAEGIYLYADKSDTLGALCRMCGIETGGREVVVPRLISWLFDAEDIALPALSYIEARTHGMKKQKKLFFGEKLGRVMELTATSNMRLAKCVNTDVSVISRFRSGLRKPKSPLDALLSSALYDRAEKQGNLSELSVLCGRKDGYLDPVSFFDWLYDDSAVDIGGVDKILESIERFSLQTGAALPSLPHVTADAVRVDCRDYFGIAGLRDSVVRFLFDAVKCGGELYLYSDQDIGWMVGDPAYRVKWMALMTACIGAGVRIRIIHNIDRGSGEMLDAIQSWMPLYITGMIEPYVCHLGRDARFSKTIFIRKNAACIVGSVLRGKEDIGYYEYVTAPKRIRIHTSEFESLMANSSPLLNIYFKERTPDTRSACCKSLSPGLSFGSLPKEVLHSMLDRSSLSAKEREELLRVHEEKRTYFESMIEGGMVTEFVSLPSDEELFSGTVRPDLPTPVCVKDVFYTPEEYGAHVAAIIDIMEKNKDYSLVLLPEMPFPQLRIVETEQSITVTRMGELYAAFVFSEPRLLRSFSEYFTLLEQQYRIDGDKVRRELARFL